MTATVLYPLLTRNCADGQWGVDPDLLRESCGSGRACQEALRTGGVGSSEDLLSLPGDLGGVAEVDLLGREQADAAMAVLGVVPLEELPAEVLCLLDAAEPAGEAGMILDRFEVRLRVAVVVGDTRHRSCREGSSLKNMGNEP